MPLVKKHLPDHAQTGLEAPELPAGHGGSPERKSGHGGRCWSAVHDAGPAHGAEDRCGGELRVPLALAVVAVALVVALWREYGLLWTDPATYLILAVPVLAALLGMWLLGRSRQG
jgi:hypothetical protein